MKLLILLLAVTLASSVKLPKKKTSCDDLDCKAGRECVMVEEQPQCLCVISCPDHFKPVCGSDKKSYENHCQLHQQACLSGEHIRIEHKGFCKKKKQSNKEWKKDRQRSLLAKKDLQEELQNDLVNTLKKDESKTDSAGKNKPAVCYGPQRNAIRFLLVEHWQESLKDQAWYSEGMTFRESLWGWFYSCDANKDNYLTPEELLVCAKKVAFFARPGQDNELTKELCIDAMVSDGDRTKDWRLDFEEFTRIMNPKYQPKDKKCSLEGKNYLDGEQIHLICNHCVCAVGNWVCSQDCDTENKKTSQHRLSVSSANDFDNAIDEHSIDPLHASADTWTEENLKEKNRLKELLRTPQKEDHLDKFFDFDTNVDVVVPPSKKKENKKEEEELEMEEYYDDLYEKTKSKKKHSLEKALKEIQLLKKKNKQFQKIIKDSQKSHKSGKRNHQNSQTSDQDLKNRMMKNYNKSNFKEHFKTNTLQPPQQKPKKKYSLDKYAGDLFDKNSWNDLII